jgi:RHS repeat-associated protein
MPCSSVIGREPSRDLQLRRARPPDPAGRARGELRLDPRRQGERNWQDRVRRHHRGAERRIPARRRPRHAGQARAVDHRGAATHRRHRTHWTANARDAELNLTQQTAGNGIVTIQSFDQLTGRLAGIVAGTSNGVESLAYAYDRLGNMLTRQDANTGLAESFSYDSLNRLTSSSVSLSPTPLVKAFAYDPVGNLLSKSDVGNYAYPAPGASLPHAVSSIAGGAINTTFSYDANGNQTAGLGRNVVYTSYNKPANITQGAKTIAFSHDIDHQRFKQTSPEGATYYLDAFGVHVEYFLAGTSYWSNFLSVGGTMVGVYTQRSDQTTSTRYFHKDHLGSIAVITDETGAVVERLSYDAWGKRRFANGTDDPTGSIASQTTRGFTGEEFLADVGLVHLNGRIYDPLVGRMMSADPFVPDPTNAQAWNRYSYVINNPLAFTDPNGYCFLGLCGLGNAISGAIRSIGSVLNTQFLTSILKIGAVALCTIAPGCAPFIPLVAAVTSAVITGVTTGRLDAALQAGLIAGATAFAFQGLEAGIGGSSGFLSGGYFGRAIGSALIGCGAAAASGGRCGAGALSGAITSLAGPITNGQNFAANLIANSVVGGLASVAGGGKFADGAVTGAFQYVIGYAALRSQQGVDGADGPGYAMEEEKKVKPLQILPVDLFAWAGLSQGFNPYSTLTVSDRPSLPDFDGGKTSGKLLTPWGSYLALESGWAGPALDMDRGSPGFDIVTRTHVEGHAAAWMSQNGVTSATLFINNPQICSSCSNLLPRMLPVGSALTIVLPNGNAVQFQGIRP